MPKRLLIDFAIGVLLQFIATVGQFLGYLVASLVGVATYESAPPDPLNAPGWLTSITVIMLGAAPVCLIVSLAMAWLLKVATVAEGLVRGAIWTAVVALAHLGIGLANATTAIFLSAGLWIMFAAVWLGPTIAGWLRGRRLAH